MDPQLIAQIRPQRARLSLAEGLFLAGVIVIVISSIGGVWGEQRRRGRLEMARADLRSIVLSAQRYFRENGTWPGAHFDADAQADTRIGRQIPNREIMSLLLGIANRPDTAPETTPKMYLEVADYAPGLSGLDEQGDFLDPWGKQYQIVVDANLDNVCDAENTIYGRLIGEGIVAWSGGPDGISDTADDILSWSKANFKVEKSE